MLLPVLKSLPPHVVNITDEVSVVIVSPSQTLIQLFLCLCEVLVLMTGVVDEGDFSCTCSSSSEMKVMGRFMIFDGGKIGLYGFCAEQATVRLAM
jgi:hypothetical protein